MTTQTIDATDLNSSPTRRPGESPRQQSVCIEIPVSVHGSRSATGNLNNTQSAKPFLEETRTMIVFPSGAVLRLTEPVSEGQILILKNPRVKQEVACRVVSSKTNASAKGYVEVEFFQAAPGFWGITFPSATSSPSAPVEPAPVAPAPVQSRVEPSAAKPAFFQPTSVAPTTNNVVTPKPVAPVAPVISKPAPAPAPVIPAAVVPEPPAPAPLAATPFVAAPIISEPIVQAPVAVKPAAPVLTPDSTQELNAAIAAAYRSQPEPVKPVQKSEPFQEAKQEAKPVKASAPVSAPPNPSITDSVPAASSKPVNPTKPKSVPPVKASAEPISSEPLAMAESIGYPSSEFSSYSKSGKSSKQTRASAAASSSSIETRKVELTSSQIASEALGKPMFGSNADASSDQKTGSSSKWIVAVAAAVLLAGGAGSYWWLSTHKLGAAKSNTVSAAAPVTPPSTAPTAAAAPPLAGPSSAGSQPSSNPSAKPSSTASQKPGSVPNIPNTVAANSLVAKTDKTDKSAAPANSHRPTVLPSEKIAAPVTHTDNSSIAAMPAPDLVSKNSAASGASLSTILPGMGQPGSAPAPPPPSRSAGPLPSASTLQQPKLIQSSSPVYPKIAATRGDWGDVIIDAAVGENGRVTDATVVSGPETLRQSALQVVRTQTYQPAKLNGKPVSMHVMVKVPFPKPH
jgi:TonB family protein